jgi:predicted TIM-barrel fold metal-dependent hydrolase
MSGTDWPIKTDLLDYPGRIDLYRKQLPIFNAAEREDILYRTVQKVWPFGL